MAQKQDSKKNVNNFKSKIKFSKPESYPCQSCEV